MIVGRRILADMTVKEAIKEYFAMGGIAADGGYNDRFFLIRLGGLPFVNYNSRARIKAAKIHDIHHVATGYRTDFKGECEIGAWEIASGCGPYIAAWILNLMAFSVGLFIWPQAMWQGFRRGRYSQNFYHLGVSDNIYEIETLALPPMFGLDKPIPQKTLSDVLSFIVWSLYGVLLQLCILPLYLLFPIHYLVYKLIYDENDRLKNYKFLRRSS